MMFDENEVIQIEICSSIRELDFVV